MYKNKITKEIRTNLPKTLKTEFGINFNPSPQAYYDQGWREVIVPDVPEGYVVQSYLIEFDEESDNYKKVYDLITEEQAAQNKIDNISQELLDTALIFRTILRQHFGENAETNHVITEAYVRNYFLSKRLNQLSDPNDALDILFLEQAFADIKEFTLDGTSWSFPWYLLEN